MAKTFKIELSGKAGRVIHAIVDEVDYLEHRDKKFYLDFGGYARRNTRSGEESALHRLIAKPAQGLIVDHLNGDKLDNRRSNLRVCTYAENNSNVKSAKGYSYDVSRDSYIVFYKGKSCGRYKTEAEAKRAHQLLRSGVEYVPRGRKHRYMPRGVTRQHGKYIVRPSVDGKRKSLGVFTTIAEAVQVLEAFRKELQA